MADKDCFGIILAEISKLRALSTLFNQTQETKKIDKAAAKGISTLLNDIAEIISGAANEMEYQLRIVYWGENDVAKIKNKQEDGKAGSGSTRFNTIDDEIGM